MKQKRILIVRPDRIGDVVLSTPIPREIKKQFPDSYIGIFVREYTKDIYQNNPHVDEVLLFEDYQTKSILGFFKDAVKLRKHKFSHALMLLPNERINYLLFFAGIPTRVGSGHKLYQFITGVKSVSRNKYVPLRHEADYCMDLARKIGVKTSNIDSEVFLNEKQIAKVQENRSMLLGDKKFLIGIHSTSGNSAPNWTVGRYKELVNKLSKTENIQVVVTDNNVHVKINNIESVKYPNLSLSLSESLVNFAALDLIVSASTGPMHLAAGLKVKTVALFCPLTACSPKLWGPKGNDASIMTPSEDYCQSQCPGDPKKCTFEKEGGIQIDEVIQKIMELLQK